MAQDDSEYRLEVGVGAGMMGYLGDFNGNLTKDLQPAVSLMGRYVFNPYMALRLNVARGTMKGASADVETYYPDYADQVYTFKNSLYDASVLYELNFWPYGTGRDYRGAKRLTPFVFAGLGMTYADVKTDGAKKGKVAFNLPLGLGLKYKIGTSKAADCLKTQIATRCCKQHSPTASHPNVQHAIKNFRYGRTRYDKDSTAHRHHHGRQWPLGYRAR